LSQVKFYLKIILKILFRAPKEDSNLGQLVKFHQFLDKKNHDDPIIAVCFPLEHNQVLWNKPLYFTLEELEVCDCNQNQLESILENNGPLQ
jgi:hypothetical protein